ncbi:restriction endonuclease [Latilactobacillus curvatus]|uniref:restriction endonuclease n=1 Tax=Latilactobacillus curvatus TaxID=28038 RepID=UPI001E44DADD|nr:restriction endonuclease [Latilactobacillus curvatus]
MENNCERNGNNMDVSESVIHDMYPGIFDILLIDRTTSTKKKNRNIIWANDNYLRFGSKAYAPSAEIKVELITGYMNNLIMPRALKNSRLQKERTKTNAEVFTPIWVVKKQNDEIDQKLLNQELEKYVKTTWIEIACGEAPYMVTRYDMESGEPIAINDRVGFVDRKLARINREVSDKVEWDYLVEHAYKASYGFEWNGDSLLLARENLLYSYRDYYFEKWKVEPQYKSFEEIARIISYNIFQMDGLKYQVPLTERREEVFDNEISLFDEDIPESYWTIKVGKRVKIMDWNTNNFEYFDKGLT